MRREAAVALAKIPGLRSEAVLVQTLGTSQDKRLRAVAAASLAQRKNITAHTRNQALLRLRSEPDSDVRHGLATLLARELPTHPELRVDLTALLRAETDDRVRLALLRGFVRSSGGLPGK
jgi:HEAT repeat protein